LIPKIVFVSAMALVILGVSGVAGQNRTGTIKVIGTGKAEGMPILNSWFTTEPSTDALIIPTRVHGVVTADSIRRFMRIYFPRTYEELLEYGFLFLAQVDMQFLGPREEKWLYDALTEHRKGAVNTRSVMSMNDVFNLPWRDSPLSRTFPNDAEAVVADKTLIRGARTIREVAGDLVIRDDLELPAIMSPFKDPIEGAYGQYRGLNTIPKPGSVILSYLRTDGNVGQPVPGQVAHVFYWRWNRSITFTFQDMIYDRFWSSRSIGEANPYALDIIANIVWFSTGRELPGDPYRVHEYRSDLYEFATRKNLLVSLLDFAERFGANPSREYRKLRDVEDIKSVSTDLYLDAEFDSAVNELESALELMAELEGESRELKDKALLWVYFVEWAVTTGVFLFAGFVLWTLMVRRRLYREVGITALTL